MKVKIKKVTLWRTEVENKPGALAAALEGLAGAKADLQSVMGYCYPGNKEKAAIELCPITTKKAQAAAQKAGFTASTIPTLVVEGNNKAGLGHRFAQALADAGINVDFLIAQVIGSKVSAIFGFDTEDDANKAAAIIKKAARK